MKKIFLLPLLFFFTQIKAQSVPGKIAMIDKVLSHYINHDLEIEFAVNKRTTNLLVLLTDSTGHTVFLDDRYDFQGDYQKTIHLPKIARAKYFLKVINDEGQIGKTFITE